MKTISIFILIFLIYFFAKAQTYHSFIHDLAVWDEYEATDYCDAGNGCVEYYETIWILKGDKTVNNLLYKKLYFEVVYYEHQQGSLCIGLPSFWSEGYFWNPYLFGLIREDTAHKVFLIANPTVSPPVVCSATDFSSEKILYDFDLNLGDTVSWKPFNNIVIGIDSVQAPNGEFLRRIKFDDSFDQWVEGLGSKIALFGSYMPPPFECGCVLECAEATDLLPPNALPCGFPVGITNLQVKDKIQIFPNPFSDFVSITSPFQSSAILSVMNLQGQLISKKKLQPLEKISFTKNELPAGDFIFFQLISDEGISQSGIAVHVY